MRILAKGLVSNHVSCLTIIVAFLTFLLSIDVGFMIPAHAQAVPKAIEEGGPENALRIRKNQWTVGVAGGIMSGTNMIFADELSAENLHARDPVRQGASQGA